MSNEQQANQQQQPIDPASNTPANGSRHKVRALSHSLGEAGTKTKQVGVMCEITEGPCKGFVSTWYGSFTEDAVEYTMRGLEALGYKGDAPECKSMYAGQEGLAQFEIDKDRDGRPRTRISFINGMDVVMKERYTGAALANFSAQINAYYRNKHGGGGGAVAGALPPMQQPPAQHQQTQQPMHTQQQLPNGRGQQSSAPPWGDDVPPAGTTEQAPRSGRW